MSYETVLDLKGHLDDAIESLDCAIAISLDLSNLRNGDWQEMDQVSVALFKLKTEFSARIQAAIEPIKSEIEAEEEAEQKRINTTKPDLPFQ